MGVFFRSWSEQVTEPSVVDQDHAKVRTPCPSTLSRALALCTPSSLSSVHLTTSGSPLNTPRRPLQEYSLEPSFARVFLITTTSKPARAVSFLSINVLVKSCTYDKVTSTNTCSTISVYLNRLKLLLIQKVFFLEYYIK